MDSVIDITSKQIDNMVATQKQLRKAVKQSSEQLRPPPDLQLSDWADEYAYLSAESAATPGKWKTLPYQRGIMDEISRGTEFVDLMKSARIGYTKCLNNAIAYHMHGDPCPVMVVQPTIEDAQGYSKDELTPMLRDTPVLSRIMPEQKTRSADNTILRKQFPGGQVLLVGANSARGFRRVSMRKVFFDEVDGYPPTAGDEGDQIQLGTKRTDFFWNRQIVCGSTPTTKEMSRIEARFLAGDQRYYFVPCPYCKTFHAWSWDRLDWSEVGTKQNPVMVCPECEKGYSYDHQRWCVNHGQWRATQEFECCGEHQVPAEWDTCGAALCRHCGTRVSNHATFHIWAAYSFSPGCKWSKLVSEFYNVKDDPEQLKTFVNTVLAQTWEEEGSKVDENALYNRREWYAAAVPDWASVICAGVDTQDDRLECSVWGFGEEQSGLIEHEVFYGDPARQELWSKLDEILEKHYGHETGATMRIHAMAIDTGGHYTEEAYKFCKARFARNVYAIIGRDGEGRPLASRPSKNNSGRVRLFTIGVDAAKDVLYGRFRIEQEGPGYVHFPREMDYHYFEQITAEKKITQYRHGHPRHVWVNPGQKRNEALDCAVYAIGAYEISHVNPKKMRERLQRAVTNNEGDNEGESETEESESKPKKGFVGTSRRTGFVNNF